MQSVDDSAKGRETLTRCIGVIFVDSVKVLTGEKCCCVLVWTPSWKSGRGEERKKTYLKNTKRGKIKIRLLVYMTLKRKIEYKLLSSGKNLILISLIAIFAFLIFVQKYVQEFIRACKLTSQRILLWFI